MFRTIAVLVVTLFASQSFAQIIYEPVRYQHGTDYKYYYGGSDPAVHRWAERELQQRAEGRATYGWFSGDDHRYHRELFNPYDAVYSDEIPFTELSRFGYTENDARQEAYANVPLYFRKAEILATAQRDLDGSLVVPAAPQIVAHVYERPQPATTQPASRGVIIIIPKKAPQVKPVAREIALAK